MKFSSLTRQYVNRNFLGLLIAAALPAVLLIAATRPLGLIEFFYATFSGGIDLKSATFLQIFQYFAIVDFRHPLMWLLTFFGAIILISFICCGIERNMKYGTLKGIGIRNVLKNTVFIVLPAVMILTVLLHLAGLLVTTLIIFLSWLIKGLVLHILCLIIIVIVYVAGCRYLSLLVCWIPCMTLDGLNFWDAISLSVRLSSEKQGKIFLSLLAASVAILSILFVFFLLGSTAFMAGKLAVALWTSINIPVYVNAVFFELSEQPRLDVRKKQK